VNFSMHVHTKITDWQLIVELEKLGDDAARVPDTQMQWSACDSVLALAATNMPPLARAREQVRDFAKQVIPLV
jgi:hypothetical protein